jgi:hypothetical protein
VSRDCCPGEGNHASDCSTRCAACEYSGGLHAFDCPDLPDPESGFGPVSGPAEVREHLAGPDPSIVGTQKGSPMTVHSAAARQAYLEGADAAVDALTAAAGVQRASGDMTRLSETEAWLALAREDQAAAIAGVDAEQLAAMGTESVMTGAVLRLPGPGGRPVTARSDPPVIHTGNSSQAQMIEATAADVDALRGIRDGFRASGWAEHEADAEQWLAVAEQDHAAAVAGIDYLDLADMGPESVMTEPAPCGYPDPEAGQ